MEEQKGQQGKEPFVGQKDRPEMKLNPDDPITTLKIRDLATLLGDAHKTVVQDVYTHKGWALKEVIDVPIKGLYKEIKDSKEVKDVKDYFDHTIPTGGLGGPDPQLHQTVDTLVREVAQLREEIKQLKR